MAIVEMNFAGDGIETMPPFTFVTGKRASATESTLTFSANYSNLFVVSFSESSSGSFTSITFPEGCTHTELANIPSGTVTSGRAMKLYDLHNVESGTSLKITWSAGYDIYIFSY